MSESAAARAAPTKIAPRSISSLRNFIPNSTKIEKIVRSANTELFFRKRKSFQIISVVAVTKNCFEVFCFFNVHLILYGIVGNLVLELLNLVIFNPPFLGDAPL